MPESRVLVVGTTPDYIAFIHERYPGRALFLTDLSHRRVAADVCPWATDAIYCDLGNTAAALAALAEYLRRSRQSLSGVAGFDCEWLALAARIADRYSLPFPTEASVRVCRNKYLSKKRWSKFKVDCPRATLVRTGDRAVEFLRQIGGPIVIKPLAASGSELTFYCHDESGVRRAMKATAIGLAQRRDRPLYQPDATGSAGLDPGEVIVAEEFVAGDEYSCDFIIDGTKVTVVRVARKLPRPEPPFGMTLAYEVPGRLPAGLDETILADRLRKAALALGLGRALSMADFIVHDGRISLLEMTPRVGGDCLPPLIRLSGGLDTLGLTLDFAEGRPFRLPPAPEWVTCIGLRLFAESAGVLSRVDLDRVVADPQVKEVYMKYPIGHRVILPPDDYDSWILGHVLFAPDAATPLAEQCHRMKTKISLEMEPLHEPELDGSRPAGGPAN